MLHAFWGVEKALAWRRQFEDARITQSPKNYLSLNHQIHVWFDDAEFALKPLRKTSTTEIVVQWHWLKSSKLLPRTRISQSQAAFLEMAKLDDSSWGSCVAHRRTGGPIETGQTFVIRAEDPEDLPSFELLEMQWDLLRVAAICGAANVTDDSYYDLDDDEVCNLVTSGGDETVTTGQTDVVTEGPEGSGPDHTGSPSEQVEHTVASRHVAPTARESRDA